MFNRRLLIDSGGEQQTYSVLEIHVDTPDGDHVRLARVELTYNGESNLANTDNKGIAVFYGVPTGTEISYTITAAGYNEATGKWIIPTDAEYETEYVVLSPLVPTSVLEFHVKNSSGSPIRSAQVEVNYNGETNISTTDNKGVAYFEVQTNILISYTVTSAGYNAKKGTLTVETGTAYKVEYVTLTTPLPSQDTDLWYTGDSGYFGTVEITIPDGVKVLFVGATVEGGESGEPAYARMESTTKTWFNVGGEDRVSVERLIGVTPNKTYSVHIDYDSELGAVYGFAFIRYSQRINEFNPTINDY